MNFTEFLYRALSSPYGIAVTTSNPELFRAKLYAARREALNPDFEVLTFSPSRVSPANEIWIIRRPNG